MGECQKNAIVASECIRVIASVELFRLFMVRNRRKSW